MDLLDNFKISCAIFERDVDPSCLYIFLDPSTMPFLKPYKRIGSPSKLCLSNVLGKEPYPNTYGSYSPISSKIACICMLLMSQILLIYGASGLPH